MNEENGRAFVLGYEAGEASERERIIKALEEDGERYYISQETFDYVVAIVRGENK